MTAGRAEQFGSSRSTIIPFVNRALRLSVRLVDNGELRDDGRVGPVDSKVGGTPVGAINNHIRALNFVGAEHDQVSWAAEREGSNDGESDIGGLGLSNGERYEGDGRGWSVGNSSVHWEEDEAGGAGSREQMCQRKHHDLEVSEVCVKMHFDYTGTVLFARETRRGVDKDGETGDER
jgi:hypothetical protein